VTAFDIVLSTLMLSSLPAVQRGLSWQPNRPPGCAPAYDVTKNSQPPSKKLFSSAD